MSYLCGCYYHVASTVYHIRLQKHYLPLVDSEVHSTILSTTSRTVLKQKFTNPSPTDSIKECIYTFPLYDGVSVVDFTCRIGSKVLRGLVKEKKKAKQIFDQAVAKGETAGLLEQAPEAADVFSTKLGNIPAGETVTVEITYIGELKHHETEGIRFTIPTKIAPRYGAQPTVLNAPQARNDGGIKITVDVSMPEGSFIKGVQSPSHPIAVSMGTISTASNADPTMSKASATLALGSAALEKDFVLIVQSKNVGIPKALLETHPTLPNHRALMATLVPKFTLPPSPAEIVFVADRSGSMSGNIPMLISAMKVFLKSMPAGIKFNICSFGSSFHFLWPKSQTYSAETLAFATQDIDRFDANMGGTSTFAAIKATIENRYTDLPLEIILLTDGDIWDQNNLFTYVNQQVEATNGKIRIFPLGIGNGVSHSLIEGLARAGNGFAQAVQEGERLDSSVVRMLRGALSPHITDYTLEVKYEKEDDDFDLIDTVTEGMKVLLSDGEKSPKAKPEAKPIISLFDTSYDAEKDIKDVQESEVILPEIPIPKLLQAPHKIPSLFAFSRTTVYLLMSPETIQRNPTAVVLRGNSPQGPLALEIPIEIITTPGKTIHQLAAKKAVQDLEEGRGWLYDAKDQSGKLLKERYPSCFGDLVQKEAVRLGEKFQVAGKWCSFVAVAANDKEFEKNEKNADETVEQKTLVESDDDDEDDVDMGFMLLDDGSASETEERVAENIGNAPLVSRYQSVLRRSPMNSRVCDTSNFDSEFCSSEPTGASVQAELSAIAQAQFTGWSYNRPAANLDGSARQTALANEVPCKRAKRSRMAASPAPGPPPPYPTAPQAKSLPGYSYAGRGTGVFQADARYFVDTSLGGGSLKSTGISSSGSYYVPPPPPPGGFGGETVVEQDGAICSHIDESNVYARRKSAGFSIPAAGLMSSLSSVGRSVTNMFTPAKSSPLPPPPPPPPAASGYAPKMFKRAETKGGSPSLFGSVSHSQSSTMLGVSFGNSQPPNSGGLFGAFGSSAQAQSIQQPSLFGHYGMKPGEPGSRSMFTSLNHPLPAQSTQSGLLFGGLQGNSGPPATGGLFGSSNSSTVPSAHPTSLFGGFGSNSGQPTSGGLFGSLGTSSIAQSTQSGSLFGAVPGATVPPAAGGLFGSFGSSYTNPPAQSTSLFGQNSGNFGQPTTGDLFDSIYSSAQLQPTPSTSLFGGLSGTSVPPTSGGLFGPSVPSTQSDQSSVSRTSTGGIFGNSSPNPQSWGASGSPIPTTNPFATHQATLFGTPLKNPPSSSTTTDDVGAASTAALSAFDLPTPTTLFGSSTAVGNTPSTGLFGASNIPASSSGTTPGSSLFGSVNPQQGPFQGFGSANSTTMASTNPPGTGLFGSAVPIPANLNSSPSAKPSTNPVGLNNTSVAGGLFGYRPPFPQANFQQTNTSQTTNPNVETGGLFGSSTGSPAPQMQQQQQPQQRMPLAKPAASYARSTSGSVRLGATRMSQSTSTSPPRAMPLVASPAAPGGPWSDQGESTPDTATSRTYSPPAARMMKKKMASPFAFRKSGSHSPESSVVNTPAPSAVDWTTKSLVDKIHHLIALQSFDGFWSISPGLETLLNVKVEELKKDGVDEKVWVTGLVVLWLEESAQEEEGIWGLVGEKGRGWLAGSGAWNESLEGEVRKVLGV